MNEQNRNLLRDMYHLPLVCQFYQQAESVRLALLLAKKQIIDAIPARRPPSLISLLVEKFGGRLTNITLDKRLKHLTSVLKPKTVEIELDSDAISQPHSSGQANHPGNQVINRISSTGVC